MKKFVYILTAALALIALAAACNKVEPVDDNPAAKTITIKATLSDAGTRVTFDPAFDSYSVPTAMSHKWETGDQLLITDASDPSVSAVFDLVDGEGSATGVFEGQGFEAASYNVEAVPNGTFVTDGNQTQAKDGATDHLKFVAAATGVTDLSEFSLTETSNILSIIAKLPAGAAATIDKVSVEVSMFGITMEVISVALTAQEDVDGDNILKVYANVPSSFSIPSGLSAFLKFSSTNPDHKVYTRYLDLDVLGEMAEGKFNYIKLNCSKIDKYAGIDDTGSAAAPYLIADQYQLMAMKDLVVADATTYFQLLADVDLAGLSWVPFNYASPYTKAVNFDGNGHKILNLTSNYNAYPSFAGVVAGDIKNVTFVDPVITAGTQNAGVVGGYIGTGSVIGNCSGVIVQNAKVTGSGSIDKGRNVGGFGGMLGAAGTIKDCHVKGTTTIKQTLTSTGSSAGGFIGCISAAATIEGCTATADVTNVASYYTGGFIGQISAAVAANVKSCAYLGGTIKADRSNDNSPVGGFIGRIVKNANASFENCYVNGAIIDAPVCGRSGGFAGESSNGNTISSCYVKNSTISAGLNTGGFVGVLYSTTTKCYVENTTVTANKNQTGGFAAYPENATITNCYTSATVNGADKAAVGGFIGICKGNNTVQYCYENGTVTGTSESLGAFIGKLDVAPTSITKCIAWNASLPFSGAISDGLDTSTVTDNYIGTEGSIYEQAVTLGGWDFTNTWTTAATPKLR